MTPDHHRRDPPVAPVVASVQDFDAAALGSCQKIMGTSENDLRPQVCVGHVVLDTVRMEESARFMRTIGMRPLTERPDVSVFEMRGGTHLILMQKSHVIPGNAPFDLMVDDLHATYELFTSLGLAVAPIESRPAIDHETFCITEPSGHVITFYSSHASGKPV